MQVIDLASHIEEHMFKHARTFEEYIDATALRYRILIKNNKIIADVTSKHDGRQDSHLLGASDACKAQRCPNGSHGLQNPTNKEKNAFLGGGNHSSAHLAFQECN